MRVRSNLGSADAQHSLPILNRKAIFYTCLQVCRCDLHSHQGHKERALTIGGVDCLAPGNADWPNTFVTDLAAEFKHLRDGFIRKLRREAAVPAAPGV